MPIQPSHRALYAAFDRFPSQKGAAVHINRMAQTLFEYSSGGLLYVLGDQSLPAYQKEDRVEIFRYRGSSENFLERALGYGHRLWRLIERQNDSLEICHFRDPWSGVPILANKDRRYKTVYEVNGLPSIELPYAYPNVAPRTLEKIRAAEAFCWSEADSIITPSHALRQNLVGLGATPGKITVISNGADLAERAPRPPLAPSRYLIYFGALQRWQGVDALLRAMTRLADIADLYLVICSSAHHRQAKPYQKLAEKIGVACRVLWFYQLRESELAPWLSNAHISIAPLAECSRNIEQGCCPLKIIEAMASGVPVIASDLPSVREIITDGVDGRLVRADRPAELAMAIRVLLEYPDYLKTLGDNARKKVEQNFTWAKATGELAALYRSIAGNGERSRPYELH
jgi:glycosyltransferase involved in cell wall biosynthesis